MRQRVQIVWCVYLVCATLSFSSLAQVGSISQSAPSAGNLGASSPMPSLRDSLNDEAKIHYERARILLGAANPVAAELEFSLAYKLSGDVRILYNIAVCQKNQGRYAKATESLLKYRAGDPKKVTAQDKADADKFMAAMAIFIAPLRVEIEPPDAVITIDGERVAVAEGLQTKRGEPVFYVDNGRHILRATKAGYKPFETEIQVSGSSEVNEKVKLEELSHVGRLEVRAFEGATIKIDGKVVGVGKYSGELQSGSHELQIIGGSSTVPYVTSVVIRDSVTQTIEKDRLDEVKGGGVPAWVWLTGIGVVVAGGAAVGTMCLAQVGICGTTAISYKGTAGGVDSR